MLKKLNLYKFFLFFSVFVNATIDEKNSLIEIYENPYEINYGDLSTITNKKLLSEIKKVVIKN